MDDLIAATVPEDLGDFTTLMAGYPPDVGARISRKSATGLGAGPGADNDRVTAFENTLDRDDACRQKARPTLQCPGRSIVDDDRPGRIDGRGDPRLARRARLAARPSSNIRSRKSSAMLCLAVLMTASCSRVPSRRDG